jgi:hypothetical protein
VSAEAIDPMKISTPTNMQKSASMPSIDEHAADIILLNLLETVEKEESQSFLLRIANLLSRLEDLS